MPAGPRVLFFLYLPLCVNRTCAPPTLYALQVESHLNVSCLTLQSLEFIRYKEGALGQPSVPLNLITIAIFSWKSPHSKARRRSRLEKLTSHVRRQGPRAQGSLQVLWGNWDQIRGLGQAMPTSLCMLKPHTSFSNDFTLHMKHNKRWFSFEKPGRVVNACHPRDGEGETGRSLGLADQLS